MNTTIEHSAQPDQKEIGILAYQLWEKAGRPSGRDMEFWLEAEKQLRNAVQTVPVIPLQRPPAQPAKVQQPVTASANIRRPKLSRLSAGRRTT